VGLQLFLQYIYRFKRQALGEFMSNLLRTLIFTVIAPGTVTIVVPFLLLSWTGTAVERNPIGVVVILLGIAVYIWCAWNFVTRGKGTPDPGQPPTQLVVSGLYRYTRNPMYVGLLLILLGEALFFGSLALLIYPLVMLLIVHVRVITYEEPELRRTFGEVYEAYVRSVPRWIGIPAKK
jgi:protein-S-isoprenylcysteine O-methyltransferase Ste14